jgi:DNA polymerase V
VLDLVEKGLVTDQIVITVGNDIENLTNPERRRNYRGAIHTEAYGREVPAHSHGTHNLGRYTSSTKLILQAVNELADRLVDMNLLVRRLNIVANHVVPEDKAPQQEQSVQQLDLFTDYEAEEVRKQEEEAQLAKERKMQQALLSIRGKFGKNAILRGMNLEEGATTRDRNSQIGGHKA